MAENHVARVFHRGGEVGVLIARFFKLVDFLEQRRRSRRAQSAFQVFERIARGIRFRRGKGCVEGDDARAAGAQPVDEQRVAIARKRIGADFLERLFVDPDDHDARIVRASPAQFKAQVERTLFDVTKKKKSGLARLAEPGKSEAREPGERDEDREPKVDLPQRGLAQPLHPAGPALRLRAHGNRDVGSEGRNSLPQVHLAA